MASTPVDVIFGITGMTGMALKLYPRGSTSIANGASGDTLTETAKVGAYRATVTEALAGIHEAYVFSSGGTLLGNYMVELADDTSVYTCGEWIQGEGGTGEGSYTGTLTINDGDGNGLEGAVVNARRGGVLIAYGTTDANGQITDWVFGAYTYDLAVRLAGYQPETDTITVSANAWTKTISLTAISITNPSSATLCTVQFRVNSSATPVEGAVCKAQLLGVNQASDGTILSNEESSDTTDVQGIAELELVQKGSIVKGTGKYKIWVEIDGKPVASVNTTIPNQTTCLFEDLLT